MKRVIWCILLGFVLASVLVLPVEAQAPAVDRSLCVLPSAPGSQCVGTYLPVSVAVPGQPTPEYRSGPAVTGALPTRGARLRCSQTLPLAYGPGR